MLDNTIMITDDTGKEVAMHVLFTFDANDKQYAMVEDEEENVYALSYDDDGNMEIVEDEEELEMCQELFDTFVEENLLDA